MHRSYAVPLAGLLAAALALPQGSLSAQAAVDICPLAVRAGPQRTGSDCLDRRRLPLPPPVVWTDTASLRLLPLELTGSYRSGYPTDRNNGGLWAGRGTSGGVSGGFLAHRGAVTLALRPRVIFSQNRHVQLPDTVQDGRSPYAYPWTYGAWDMPMRPGAGVRGPSLRPGDSYLEARALGWAAGVSTERLWWGPARRYPLLFSGSAEGFPHVYASSDGYWTTPVGGVGAELLYGRLEESAWFDADARNDLRLLGALQLRWRVDFVPGLELGYSIARHEPLPDRSLEAGQLAQLFTGDPEGEDPARRGRPMGTFTFRLALPDEGMEAYGEIGRGEGFLNVEPGGSDQRLSQIYLLGFARTDTTASGTRWRVSGELVRHALDLPQPEPAERMPVTTPWHGHTHRGQMLGTYIGPGSNAQFLAFDRLGDAFTWGVFGERVRRDDDTYFRSLARFYGFRGHDVEWTLGARLGGWLGLGPVEGILGPMAFGVEGGVSRRKNRWFTRLNGENWVFLREWNGWADVYLRWDPRLR